MKREDFKSGMILHFNCGRIGLLIDYEIFFLNSKGDNFSGSQSLANYDSTTKRINSYKLIKVTNLVTPKSTNIGIDLPKLLSKNYETGYTTLIWEKPIKPIEELTMAQICKELGREIKIKKG